MKNLIITILLCFVQIACNRNGSNSSAMMPPELDSILDEYIANNPKRNVFNIVFENRNHKQFFSLQSYPDLYDSNFVDGCFMKNGKIIIFWSVNKSWKDSLLHIPQEDLCFDSLANYSYLANGSKSKAENGSGVGPAGYISQLDISLPAARPSRISVEEMVTSGAFKSQIL